MAARPQAAMWSADQEGFALTSQLGHFGGSRAGDPAQPALFEGHAETETLRERAIEAQAQAAGRRGGLAAYNDVRAAHGLPRVRSAMESPPPGDVPAALDEPPLASKVELIEGFHTGWDAPAWIVRLPRGANDFRELAAAAKARKGYYQKAGPRFPWGFYFRSRADARDFIAAAMSAGAVAHAVAGDVAAPSTSPGAAQLQRLRRLAQSLRERSEAEEHRPRLANTHRRAGQAARVQQRAREDQRRADSLERIAAAIEAGQAPALARLSSLAQLDALDLVLRRAHWEHNRVHELPHDDAGANNAVNLDHIRYPWPRLWGNHLASTIRDAKGRSSTLRALAQRATRVGEALIVVDDAKDLAALRKLKLSASSSLRQQLQELGRIQSLGLSDLPQLREAARQYLTCCRGQARQASPIAVAVRELMGRTWPGYFPTPPPAADRLIELAELPDGVHVLEPSAGKGDLADAVRRAVPDAQVDVVEPVEPLRAVLELKGYTLVGRDFLEDIVPPARYARIVMNPPFENGTDARHVRHAFDLLEPGGRLAAIVSEGLFFRDDAEDFLRWLTSVNAQTEKLPAHSFRASDRPTDVAARYVVIEKAANHVALNAPKEPMPKSSFETRLTPAERERRQLEAKRERLQARQAAETEREKKKLEALRKKQAAESERQQKARAAAVKRETEAAAKKKQVIEDKKKRERPKTPPLVRAEVIDPLTGERIPPDLPGATVTGRLVLPVKTDVGRLAVPVSLEDVDPATQTFRLLDGRADTYQRQAEEDARRVAANAADMKRWSGGERFATVAGAVAEYLTRNGLYEHIEAVADLDPVTEWMSRVEVRSGKSTKALRDTPAGRRIADAWRQGPRAGVRVALAYIFGQGKARQWSAIPWRMVDDLERLLRRAAGKEAARLGRSWDLSIGWRPATLRRGELPDGKDFADLSDADRAMVTQHHHAKTFHEAAQATTDLLQRFASCLSPELTRLVKARAATFRRWAKNPALAPQRLCDPLPRYPAITADLEQLAQVCKTGKYDPALAQRYVAEEAWQPPVGYEPDDNFAF